jgi:hypothetical protein
VKRADANLNFALHFALCDATLRVKGKRRSTGVRERAAVGAPQGNKRETARL